MHNLKKLVIFLIIALVSIASNAKVGGHSNAIPITVVPFKTNGKTSINVSKIIESDLKRSGKFDIYPTPVGEQPGSSADIKLTAFKKSRIGYVVVGTVTNTNSGVKIKAELVSVFNGKVIVKEIKMVVGKNFRRKTHEISNAIFKALTGIEGIYDTKIAYVKVVKTRQGKKSYSLIVSDSDGYAPITIKRMYYPIMSPAWAPDGKRIAYVTFNKSGQMSVNIQNVATGEHYVVSTSKGINASPAWSPDGSHLALTLSKTGNPEIYIFNMKDRRLRRLTVNAAIDTGATWTPDGRSIIFTSDRSGRPQLYRVSVNSGRTNRITLKGMYNAEAAVSPDGKKIAMKHAVGGRYNIAVMENGGEVVVITAGQLDGAPSFSPNSEMLIYAGEYNHRSVLYTLSVDGRVKVRLELPSADLREPTWGPKRQ